MNNRDLAEKIYTDLNKRGAELGNASISIIEKTLDEQLKNCNLQNASNNEALESSSDGVAVCDCAEPDSEDFHGNKWCSKCKKVYKVAN